MKAARWLVHALHLDTPLGWALLVCGACAWFSHGCGATAETRARYSVEGARCVADIQEIVQREGTTEAEDLEDLEELREDCRDELARIEGAQ